MEENERFLSWNERFLIGNGWRVILGRGAKASFLLALAKWSVGLRRGADLWGWGGSCGGR